MGAGSRTASGSLLHDSLSDLRLSIASPVHSLRPLREYGPNSSSGFVIVFMRYSKVRPSPGGTRTLTRFLEIARTGSNTGHMRVMTSAAAHTFTQCRGIAGTNGGEGGRHNHTHTPAHHGLASARGANQQRVLSNEAAQRKETWGNKSSESRHPACDKGRRECCPERAIDAWVGAHQ